VSKGSIYQYFENKDEIVRAAARSTAERSATVVKAVLETIAMEPPTQMLDQSIDYLIDFTTSQGRLIQYLIGRPSVARGIRGDVDLSTVMLTMTTLHIRQYRDHYRADLDATTIAWMFINSSIMTTLGYIESDEPIPIEQLRSALKHCARGLLKSESEFTKPQADV
jgi:AcrR family transcriptional regulator